MSFAPTLLTASLTAISASWTPADNVDIRFINGHQNFRALPRRRRRRRRPSKWRPRPAPVRPSPLPLDPLPVRQQSPTSTGSLTTCSRLCSAACGDNPWVTLPPPLGAPKRNGAVPVGRSRLGGMPLSIPRRNSPARALGPAAQPTTGITTTRSFAPANGSRRDSAAETCGLFLAQIHRRAALASASTTTATGGPSTSAAPSSSSASSPSPVPTPSPTGSPAVGVSLPPAPPRRHLRPKVQAKPAPPSARPCGGPPGCLTSGPRTWPRSWWRRGACGQPEGQSSCTGTRRWPRRRKGPRWLLRGRRRERRPGLRGRGPTRLRRASRFRGGRARTGMRIGRMTRCLSPGFGVGWYGDWGF